MQMCRFVFDTSKTRSYDVKSLNYTGELKSFAQNKLHHVDSFEGNDNPEAEPFIPEGGVHHTSKADSDFGKVRYHFYF